jgi:hypothetical protein
MSNLTGAQSYRQNAKFATLALVAQVQVRAPSFLQGFLTALSDNLSDALIL